MNWYYAEGGQQRGPVTDTDLDNLVRAGTIQQDTLVWREGMPEWQPYSSARGQGGAPPHVSASVGGTGGVVCAECKGVFPPDQVMQYGGSYVCGTCKPTFVQKLKEGAVSVGVMEYAGFWIRAGAHIIDSIITNVMSAVVGFVIGFSASAAGSEDAVGMQLAASGIGFLLAVVYYVFFNGRFGATPGKMVCGIKIVTAEGEPIGYGRALGRFFASIVSGLICGIGYLMVAFDDEKRALHDRMCNTRVIKK